jgi:hypothetical protein
MKNKDEMIKALIKDDLNDWFNPKEKDVYFAQLLNDGFVGYRNQTIRELVDECVERGLIELKSNYPECKMCGIDNYVCLECERFQREVICE